MARRPRGFFKASPWELEDAEEEGVEIVINHAPKRFVIENGKLIGMEFERWNGMGQRREEIQTIDTVFLPATT
jgi:formate dehydrogenase (NADP+) beta subunit